MHTSADTPADTPADASPVKAPIRPAQRPPRAMSTRRRARELALQGLYEWLVGGADAGVIDAHMREQGDFAKCDPVHFDAVLHGVIAGAPALATSSKW